MPVCKQCHADARPFPAAVLDGDVEMTESVPFVERLAFKCTRCGDVFCAPCCHPAETARLLAAAPSLPRPYTTARDDAACPRCRGLVRPLGSDEVDDAPGKKSEDKPVSPAQRVMAFGVAAFGGAIAAWCFSGGAWGRGLFWAAIAAAAVWAARSR